MKEKLTSRKFWMAVAAFLASIATSIAGLATDHEVIATIGIACGVVAAAIYAAAEAYVDGKREESTTESVDTCINLKSDSSELAESVLYPLADTPKTGGTD